MLGFNFTLGELAISDFPADAPPPAAFQPAWAAGATQVVNNA
jgi:hypothetical protein